MSYILHLGDCLEVMRGPMGYVDAVITDPPYGIGIETNYRDRKRTALAVCNNFSPIAGDDMPFDPTPFLGFKAVILFGANYFADGLPTNGAWHVWDKLYGLTSKRPIGFNDNSDCEFIWASKRGAARIFRHRWMGAMKDSEQDERRVHPTQKPISLMMQLIEMHTKPGDTILDPYMGSGTTGVACIKTGRNFIGIEIDPTYYRVAQRRIEDAAAQPMLLEVTS